MPGVVAVTEPIGYRAYTAWSADDARPTPPHIDQQNFSSAADARAWVETCRAGVRDRGNFACCIIPIYRVALN
jgi:hypothetical protein